MTLTQVWGCLLILVVSPCVGAFCLTLPRGIQRRSPGWVVLGFEMLWGVAVVVLSRYFFRAASPWELLALLALVMGRYWRRQDTVMVAVLGGLLLHDWQMTLIVGFIGVVGLTLFRQVRWGIWEIIALITLALVVRHGSQMDYTVAAIALSGTLAWISASQPQNRRVWSFFKPEHHFFTLDQPLSARQVGEDAARLSQIKQWGYPVTNGWILAAGDDLHSLLALLKPDGDRPYMVRLSSEKPSQHFYIPIEHLTTTAALETAILSTYSNEDLGKQAILVQEQPKAVWSGITYSRPPLRQTFPQEPLSEVVQDLITPLVIGDGIYRQYLGLEEPRLVSREYPTPPPTGALQTQAIADPPQEILRTAAQYSRELEKQWGLPQGIEWVFDGEQLWILRLRPLQHLQPMWTRDFLKREFSRPLQPLSASLVESLLSRAIASLQTALLPDLSLSQPAAGIVSHFQGYSYLNQSYLETLLSLTGLNSVLNLRSLSRIRHVRWYLLFTHPRLFWRYVRWDWRWQAEWEGDRQRYILPTLNSVQLDGSQPTELSQGELEQGIEQIQAALENLLGHYLRGQGIRLGRRSLFHLPKHPQPLPPALRELRQIAQDIEKLVRPEYLAPLGRAALFSHLAEHSDGSSIFQQVDDWLAVYGYGADYPWELAQARWREDTATIRQRITALLYHPETRAVFAGHGQLDNQSQSLEETLQQIQDLLHRYLAQGRGYFLAIAQRWQTQGYLDSPRDIFWLTYGEIKQQLHYPLPGEQLKLQIQYRRSQYWDIQAKLTAPPPLMYGQPEIKEAIAQSCFLEKLTGQPASEGSAIGQVRLCPYGEHIPRLEPEDILVTPYLHERLLPLIPELNGIITTRGGLLSQGASLARQHGIPMAINVENALRKLRTGQWIHLDGNLGLVELLDANQLSIEKD